jgi:hypothetical protein
MDSRDVFFELLNKTQISNVEDAEQAQAKLVRMQEWLLNNVPHKLYRFRSSNTNNFTALKEDSIWGSRIDTFNDPFECVPCYDAQKCDELLGRTPDIQFVQSIIEQLAQGDDSRTQNIVKTIVPPDYVNMLRINAKQIKVNKATYDALKIFQANIHTELAKHFPDLLRDFFAGMKYAQQYVACFTEERDATLMWGHYAEEHKGFCVEYDFAADLKRCTKPCKDIRGCRNFMLNWALAPVQYNDKRFDATSYLMTVMQDYIGKKVGMPLNPFLKIRLCLQNAYCGNQMIGVMKKNGDYFPFLTSTWQKGTRTWEN